MPARTGFGVWAPREAEPLEVRQNGVRLHVFSNDIVKAAQSAAYDLYEEEAGKNPAWKKLYEPWKRFRASEFLWHRAAEFTYLNFVYNNPLGKK